MSSKIAIGRRLELLISLHRVAVLSHQTTNTVMTNIKTRLLHLFAYVGLAVAVQRQAELF